jgi:hypothetical protein
MGDQLTAFLKRFARAVLYPGTLFGGDDPFYMPTFLRRDGKPTESSAETQGAMVALAKVFGLMWLAVIVLSVAEWISEKLGHPLF